MATPVIAYRFPDGTELRTAEAQTVGGSLTNDGEEWVVVEVSANVEEISVTVQPVEATSEPGADNREPIPRSSAD